MKKIVSLLTVVFICLMSFQPVSAWSIDISLHSQYAYLYDRETSLVYLDKKSNEKIFPASMTKILTVSLALDKIKNLQQTVTIVEADLAGLKEMQATVAGFYAGEKVTYEDLIYGALLPSGADACNALARLTYGSLEKMVSAMNQKGLALGLKNSHFMNVTGLHDEQHYTTTHDMALILNDALKNQAFVKVFEARKHTSSKANHQWISSLQRGKEYKNIDISHIDGGKSGFTDEAQLTFASTMTIDDHQLILVTAYAKGQYSQNHVQDAVSVYQYMNEHFHKIIIYKKDQEIQNYWITKSLSFQYHQKALQEVSFLAEQSVTASSLDIQIEAPFLLKAPIQKGEQLGRVIVQYQGQTLYEYQLTATQSIESSFMGMLLYYCIVFVLPMFVVILMVYLILRRKKRT